MRTTTTKEIVEEFDETGNVVKKTTTVTKVIDDESHPAIPYIPYYPSYPTDPFRDPIVYGTGTKDVDPDRVIVTCDTSK